MNGIRHVLLAGLGLASLASCAPAIRSDRDESIPVPRGSTWAWAAPDTVARAERGPAPVSEIVQQRFRRAIEAAVQGKGYQLVADAAQADFVLSVQFGEPRDGAPARRSTAVVVGVSAGWAYGPWGAGRFGYYRPWGFWEPWGLYQPWGWGFYGAPVWGGYAVPAYAGGGRVYSDRAVVVVLRQRPTGQVAWSARLGADALGSHSLTQDRVQELTNKLFQGLN
ncbi:MAG: DUF4136 domain-containing protein [Gemmatimonadales bacterium]|jgi:hypothetical protein